MGRWAHILNQGKRVRVIGKNTDLSFSVEGRNWQVADGKINMPMVKSLRLSRKYS